MHQPISRRQLLVGLGGLALVTVLGCSTEKKPAGPAAIAGFGPMPTWLRTAPTDVQDLYRWAADHKQELSYIPCFCGCEGPAFKHQSNYDCYFYNNKYDQHSYG